MKKSVPATTRTPHYIKAVQQLANNLDNVKTIIIHYLHPSIDEIFSEFVSLVSDDTTLSLEVPKMNEWVRSLEGK